jgi:hypothetical protein
MKFKVTTILSIITLIVLGLFNNAVFSQDNDFTVVDGWSLKGYVYSDDGKFVFASDNAMFATGIAVRDEPIDLKNGLDFSYIVNLGNNDKKGGWIIFMLTSQSITDVLFPDYCFGLIVETNSYDRPEYISKELEDPEGDLISVIKGNGYYVAYSEVGNLEDGEEHSMRISWSKADNVLNVYLDDPEVPILEYETNLSSEFFESGTVVYIAFGGFCVEKNTLQYVISLEEETQSNSNN